MDIATEADTLECAKKNLREAVEGYVESVVRDGEEDDFISAACGKVERPIYLYEHHSSWCRVYRHVCKDEIKMSLVYVKFTPYPLALSP